MDVVWCGVVLICRHSVQANNMDTLFVCTVLCVCCDIASWSCFLLCLGSPERMWNVGIDREKESADPRALREVDRHFI
jgi:hypothetical protein